MWRVRLIVFVILAVLFLICTAALHHWGRDWAVAVYRPLLLETVADACASQQHGKAERLALQALRTSPGYASPILDAVGPDLVVMPELRAALLELFGTARSPIASQQTAALGILCVRFASGDNEGVVTEPIPYTDDRALAWEMEYLQAQSLRRLGRWSDPRAAYPPFPDERDALEHMPPEIRDEIAPYVAMQRTTANDSPRGRYCAAVAALELGRNDAARQPFEALTTEGLELPDAAYRLGNIHELEAETSQAFAAYGLAVLASDTHLDAAAHYLRLMQNDAR